jgi:excisionase family DNA binding protein
MPTTLEEPVTPSDDDVNLAKQSSRSLAAFAGHGVTCSIKTGKGEPVEIQLPAAAVGVLAQMLTQMAEGKAVVLMPINAQLTTQQAADLLGVSRPFLISEMKGGKLPFQKIGTHRRIAYAELMKYRQKMAEESNAAMDSLVAEAQELKLGY